MKFSKRDGEGEAIYIRNITGRCYRKYVVE